MTIIDYLKEYNNYSFEERKINNIDYVIFSYLSYADLDKIFNNSKSIILKEIDKSLINKKNNKNSLKASVEANTILKEMISSKRYGNCKLYNYKYDGNDEYQFGAITIEYEDNKVFVSFEGTNELFSGWKENFMLSFKCPTITHKKSIDYLNKSFSHNKKEIIVGGHSKGGNLALVSSLYCKKSIRQRITKIIGADSPGLLNKDFYSKKYKKIEEKYVHIMPEYSMVGILLNHSKDIIVKSTNKGIQGHSIMSWVIDDTNFKKAKLSPLSKRLDNAINEWSNTHSDKEKIDFITNFDSILNKSNVKSIIDIKENKTKIIKIIMNSNNISESSKKTIIDFIIIIIKCFSDVKKNEIKKLINNSIQKLNRNDEK
ncbi:MAG: DUF2974 domain-containing protein [Bacilli bacterium]|nr:DUF2974 domain-containing protein [Bacilli bacterium]